VHNTNILNYLDKYKESEVKIRIIRIIMRGRGGEGKEGGDNKESLS